MARRGPGMGQEEPERAAIQEGPGGSVRSF